MLGVTTSNTPAGVQTPTVPDIVFFIDNWVSPMLPTYVVSRPQGRGTEQRVRDIGKRERRPVAGRIGPQRRRYPPRKGADFRWVPTEGNSGEIRTFGSCILMPPSSTHATREVD